MASTFHNNRTLLKNRKKKDGYKACYTYNGSFSQQYVYVKSSTDVNVIDMLIEKGFISQAVLVAESRYNDFVDVKPTK